MANPYILRDDLITPSGWSEIAVGYRERLVLLGGTPLSTGGSDTHSHTGSAVTGTTATNVTRHYSSSTPYAARNSHNHPATLTSVSTENHLPYYKNFRAVYRSETNWDGTVAAGSIVFSATVPVNWTRYDNGLSYFIRISGTPGGTGGSDSGHSHGVSGAVNNYVEANVWNGYGTTPSPNTAQATHNHGSYSATTDTAIPAWKYMGAGLVKADVDTILRKDMYIIFDATPDASRWEVVASQDGYYLKALGGNSFSSGGTNTTFIHGHTANTTSGGTAQLVILNASGTEPYFAPGHTHSITVTLNNAEIAPSFVRFILAKLKSEWSRPRSIYVMGC